MLKIFWMFKAQYLKTEMEYTFNFWMMIAAGVLMRTLMMGVAYVLFRTTPTIAGFAEGEVYLIMAFMFISEGLCNLLFDGIWYIPAMVFRGEMDVLLTRPVSPLFQVLSREIGLQGLGVLSLGVVSLTLALGSLGSLSAGSLLLCLPLIACGTALRMSTYLIGASNVFFIENNGQLNVPYTLYTVGEFAKYPVSIYPGWMQGVLLVLIPFGFIGYVPALILRGEHPVPYVLALTAMAVGYFMLARAVFYKGIARYESMGM